MSITPPVGTYKVDFNGEYKVIAGNVVDLATVDLQTLYLDLINLTPTGTHGLSFGSGETLSAGVYTVITNDLNGCSSTLFVNLTQPNKLIATIDSLSHFNEYNLS